MPRLLYNYICIRRAPGKDCVSLLSHGFQVPSASVVWVGQSCAAHCSHALSKCRVYCNVVNEVVELGPTSAPKEQAIVTGLCVRESVPAWLLLVRTLVHAAEDRESCKRSRIVIDTCTIRLATSVVQSEPQGASLLKAAPRLPQQLAEIRKPG